MFLIKTDDGLIYLHWLLAIYHDHDIVFDDAYFSNLSYF